MELSKRWKIHDVFQMSLLKQKTTRKKQIDKTVLQSKFEVNGKSEEYKVKRIWNSIVFAKELEFGHFLRLYNPIS